MTVKSEDYMMEEEPYYRSVGDEIDLFAAAYLNRILFLLKGPRALERPGSCNIWLGCIKGR